MTDMDKNMDKNMNKNMVKKVKVLAGLLAFSVLISAAYFAYNSLSIQEDTPGNLVQTGTSQAESNQTEADQADSGQNDLDQTDLSQTDSYQTETDQTETDQTDRQQAPDITVLDIDGNEVQLSSLFGKPIVLNFWATWCPSCVQESPYFEKLYQEMGSEVHFMKVNLLDGHRETRSNVERFIENNNLTVPIYFDETGAASVPYGIRFIPVTFFIDTDGNLAGTAQGAANEQILRQGIDLAR